jgi:hypothetical protein
MPKTGSTSVTIPAGIPSLKVYDDGGATGNYSNYCNSSITLTAPEGYVLKLSGKITTDNQGDALSVYDTYSTYISGANSTFSDVQVSIPTVTSIDRDMTLSFYSNYNGNYDGLDLTVTLIKNVLTLEDGSDNSEAIETAAAISGKVYDVTLSGRTLYKDGSWNTLCLPFALDDFSGTPLEEAKVVTLGNSEGCNTGYANNTLNLEFLAASEIEAGVPYLVRWTKAEGYDSADPATRDIVDPVFTGVTIENETPADRSILSGDGYVDFVGTYSPVDFTADDRSILYLGTSNALYWPGTDMTLRAFRAYFQLKKDLTAGEILSARMYFGDSESETTSLNEEFATATGATATWYTLDGRKLSGKPTKKGVYINNGKKTVVK